MTSLLGVDFLFSGIASLFGLYAGALIWTKHRDRVLNRDHGFALYRALGSLIVLQIISILQRSLPYFVGNTPQETKGYILPAAAMIILYSLLIWLAFFTYSVCSGLNTVANKKRRFNFGPFFLLMAILLPIDFVTTAPENLALVTQLGIASNQATTPEYTLWIKYLIIIGLTVLVFLSTSNALFTSKNSNLPLEYAVCALLFGLFFIRLFLNGIYLTFSILVYKYLVVFEILGTLICGLCLAISVQSRDEGTSLIENEEREEILIEKNYQEIDKKLADQKDSTQEQRQETELQKESESVDPQLVVEEEMTFEAQSNSNDLNEGSEQNQQKSQPFETEKEQQEDPETKKKAPKKEVAKKTERNEEESEQSEPKGLEQNTELESKTEEHKNETHHHKEEAKHSEHHALSAEEKLVVDEMLSKAEQVVEELNEISTEVKEFAEELKKKGLEDTRIILAIDCTASNAYSGKKSFRNKPLHTISNESLNFYEQVICILGSVIDDINPGAEIPVYLFGDSKTKDRSVKPLYKDSEGHDACSSVTHVLAEYRKVIPKIELSGPTSFRPTIEKAIEISQETGQFQLLVIIGDGAVTDIAENAEIIIQASEHPIMIVMVGVGDGDVKQNPQSPWQGMITLDSELKNRKFDNFTFVQFSSNLKPEEFAKSALRELPDAFNYCVANGLFRLN